MIDHFHWLLFWSGVLLAGCGQSAVITQFPLETHRGENIETSPAPMHERPTLSAALGKASQKNTPPNDRAKPSPPLAVPSHLSGDQQPSPDARNDDAAPTSQTAAKNASPQDTLQPWETPLGLVRNAIEGIEPEIDKTRALKLLWLAQLNSGQIDHAATTHQEIQQLMMKLNELMTAAREENRLDDFYGLYMLAYQLHGQTRTNEEIFLDLIADREFGLALLAAQQAATKTVRIPYLRKIFDAALLAGDTAYMREAALQLQQAGAGSEALVDAAKAICVEAGPEKAMELVDHAQTLDAKALILAQVALAWSKRGNQAQTASVAQQVQEILNKIDNRETSNACTELITAALTNIGEYQQALTFIKQATEANDHAYATRRIAESLLNSGKSELALEWAGRIHAEDERAVMLLKVADSNLEEGEHAMAVASIQKAAKLTYDINKPSIKRRLRIQIASAYMALNKVDDALMILDEELEDSEKIEDPLRRAFGLSQLAAAMSNAGATQKAEDSLKRAKNEINRIGFAFNRAIALGQIAGVESAMKNVEGCDATLNSAKDLAAKIHDPYKRFVVLHNIATNLAAFGELAKAKKYNDLSYHTIASRPCESQVVQDLALRRFFSLGRSLGDEERANAIQPTAFSIADQTEKVMRSVDHAVEVSSQGDVTRAIRLLGEAVAEARRLDAPSSCANLLREIATEYLRLGDFNLGSETLMQAVTQSRRIGDEFDLVPTLSGIAVQTAFLHDVEQAAPILNEIRAAADKLTSGSRERETVVLTQIASTWLSLGAKKRGMDLLAELAQDANGSPRDLLGVASVYEEAEEHASAAKSLKRAADLVLDWNPESPRDFFLETIAEALVRVGETEQAIQLARQIDDYAGAKSKALRTLSILLAGRGELEMSLDVALEVERSIYRVEAIGGVVSKLDSQTHPKLYERAVAAMKSMADAVAIPIEDGLNSSMCQVATELARAGQHKTAFQVASRVRQFKQGHRTRIETEVIRGITTRLIRSGDIETAIDFIRSCPEKQYWDEDISQLASDLASEGHFKSAVETIEGVKDEVYKLLGLGQLASVLYRAQKIDLAHESVQKALTIADNSRNPSLNSYAINHLVTVALQLQDTKNALVAARKISDPVPRSNALIAVAMALSKSGDSQRAYEIIQEVPKTLGFASFYNVAVEMANAGDVNIAIQLVDYIENMASKVQVPDQNNLPPHQSWMEAEALEAVASSLTKNGEIEEALKLVERIKLDDYKMSASWRIVVLLVENGQFERAIKVAGVDREKVLNQMIDVMTKPASSRYSRASLIEAMTLATEIGDSSKAMVLKNRLATLLIDLAELDLALENERPAKSPQVSKFDIAYALATKPISASVPGENAGRRMQANFSEAEKTMARRIYRMLSGEE
ncbi:MAG: hypothetical protein ABL888_16585 [Pirellulaceae bacterium]